jgi:alpha-beta hydrolase superfamily lysophospholipase
VAPIHCQPWDIGTGVTGYVWRAPNPRAVLLVEHGWRDYAQRYVKQSSLARMGGFLLPTYRVPVPPGDPPDQSRDMQFNERLAKDPLYGKGQLSWVTAGSGATTSQANWKQYQHLTVPVLLVNGAADTVTDASGGREFIEAVRSPRTRLAITFIISAHGWTVCPAVDSVSTNVSRSLEN